MADENDDLLNPDEIEALLQDTASDRPADDAPAEQPSAADSADGTAGSAANDALDSSDIEALLKQRDAGQPTSAPESAESAKDSAESLIEQAESGLNSALAANLETPTGTTSEPNSSAPPELGPTTHYDFEDFNSSSGLNSEEGRALSTLQDVELDLRIELGRTELLIQEVLELKDGSVVPLDKLAGDPLDILVNGRLIARGEVLVLNDNFCVRVAEILTPDV